MILLTPADASRDNLLSIREIQASRNLSNNPHRFYDNVKLVFRPKTAVAVKTAGLTSVGPAPDNAR
jgi:hypothetical protein